MSTERAGFPAGDLRVSDAERDRALSELTEAYEAGRITAEEFDQRSTTALSARTGNVEPDASYVYPGVYPGPTLIIHEIETPRGVAHNVMARTCGIIDFPLSAALDTVLLPFDWPYSVSQRAGTTPFHPTHAVPK